MANAGQQPMLLPGQILAQQQMMQQVTDFKLPHSNQSKHPDATAADGPGPAAAEQAPAP